MLRKNRSSNLPVIGNGKNACMGALGGDSGFGPVHDKLAIAGDCVQPVIVGLFYG